MIPPGDVVRVPISRVLRLVPGPFRWNFGTVCCAPSPRAPAPRRASYPNDLQVQKNGSWSDAYAGRSGTDLVSLFGYVCRIGRADALAKLAAELQPGDLLVDRLVHVESQRNPFKERSEPAARGTTVDDARLAKFAARGTPRQRAAALTSAAWAAAAKDRRGN